MDSPENKTGTEGPFQDHRRIRSNDEIVDEWLETNAGQTPGGEYIIMPAMSYDLPFTATSPEIARRFLEAFYDEIERRGIGRRPGRVFGEAEQR